MRPVRTVLLLVLMLLLPLQSLQAAGLALCGPAVAGEHGAHAHAHAPQQPAAAVHAHEHAQHHDHGAATTAHHHHPQADAGTAEAVLAASVDGAAQATTADLGGNPDLGACCHVVASLPVQPAALPAVPPALDTPRLQGLPALSHTTGGPFRPPRPLPA